MIDNETSVRATPDAGDAPPPTIEERFLAMEETDAVSEPEQEEPDAEPEEALDDEPEEDVEEEAEEGDESDEDEQDDESEDDESEGSEEPELHTVKVEGEERQVTLDELKKSYGLEATHTRKFQALAEERKTFEAEQEQTRVTRAAYAERVAKLDEALEKFGPRPPSADLRTSNPAEYAAQAQDYQAWQAQQQATKAELERLAQEAQADQSEQLRRIQEEQKVLLLKAVPELSEDGARTELAQYAIDEYGFTAEDLSGVIDHRVVVLLHKARQFDALKTEGKAVTKGEKKPTKTMPPGGRRPARKGNRKRSTEFAKARERLRKTGSLDDAAAAFEAMEG